jgi:bacillithiol biosynthesis deacetylase BshB1
MNISFIGIHPDDIELGCGGAVIIAVAGGHDVTLIDLSSGDSSSNGTPGDRAREADAAARILGVSRRINLGLPDTGILSESAEQVMAVVESVRRSRPELVFIPTKNDPHPDHASGGELIERALYLSAIQGFETGHEAWKPGSVFLYMGRRDVEPHLVLDVSAVQDVKKEAILAHRSQFVLEAGRKPTALNSPEFLPFVESRSRIFGRMIGAAFGEPFQITQPLRLNDLAAFKGGF